jgi:hypothetical protein
VAKDVLDVVNYKMSLAERRLVGASAVALQCPDAAF